MPFVEVKDVRKVFSPPGVREPLVAIDRASFQFEAGELVSLLGPSGCGKTTVLRIIAGLVPKTSGSVRIAGSEVVEPRASVGFVFQSPNLMPWRSVLDNVLFPAEILRRRNAQTIARARDLLKMVGLADFERARAHQLSGGMQQRVALCRALVHEPTLLLMDEPFGALDELTRMEMNDLLLDIRRQTKATVAFVTHSIAEAVYLADQVLVFSKRPARIAETIAVSLGYPRSPRTRYSPEFTAIEHRASRALGVIREDAGEHA
jgi:NitT/TauT family transport system ATP-binding protein